MLDLKHKKKAEETGNPASRPASPDEPLDGAGAWSYQEAFCRNAGLIDEREQQRLRNSRVAIVGMGGVGGIHLITLARLGVGRFTIADPDSFEVANFNRQYGASLESLGRGKTDVMAEEAKRINPELDIRVYREAITPDNVGDFLVGADVFLDAIDFFSFDARRMIFREARERGIWAITAGPIGFSTAWLIFDPNGMSFDEYFDLHDGMQPIDQFAAFVMGLTPRGTQFRYIDLSQVDSRATRGPSAGLACNLSSGVAAVETAKIILGREPLRPVPCYAQFDAYRCILRRGRLAWANRGLLQRLKRAVLRRRMLQLGYGSRVVRQ